MVGYWIKVSQGISSFEFEEHLFTSMPDMISHIIQAKSIINIREACVFNIGFKKNGETIKNKVQICESFRSFLKKDVKKKVYKIRNKNVHSVKTYTCYGKTFTNFDEALSYMLNTKCVIKTPNDETHLDHKRTTFIPPVLPKQCCVTLLTGIRCLTQDTSAYNVWLNNWNNCDYDCFKQQNYQSAKYRFIKEINDYRKLFGVKPAELSDVLFMLAQKHADFLNRADDLSNDSNKFKKQIVGYAFVKTCRYFVKILFDSYIKYKKIPSHLRIGNDGFGSCLSHKTSYLGIGISNRFGKIFIVLMCN